MNTKQARQLHSLILFNLKNRFFRLDQRTVDWSITYQAFDPRIATTPHQGEVLGKA